MTSFRRAFYDEMEQAGAAVGAVRAKLWLRTRGARTPRRIERRAVRAMWAGYVCEQWRRPFLVGYQAGRFVTLADGAQARRWGR